MKAAPQRRHAHGRTLLGVRHTEKYVGIPPVTMAIWMSMLPHHADLVKAHATAAAMPTQRAQTSRRDNVENRARRMMKKKVMIFAARMDQEKIDFTGSPVAAT